LIHDRDASKIDFIVPHRRELDGFTVVATSSEQILFIAGFVLVNILGRKKVTVLILFIAGFVLVDILGSALSRLLQIRVTITVLKLLVYAMIVQAFKVPADFENTVYWVCTVTV
jgi:hypothetical protein